MHLCQETAETTKEKRIERNWMYRVQLVLACDFPNVFCIVDWTLIDRRSRQAHHHHSPSKDWASSSSFTRASVKSVENVSKHDGGHVSGL